MHYKQRRQGFTLIESLVVIAIIGILSVVVLTAVVSARGRARDARRKVEIAQIGRLLSAVCFLPAAGNGVYDLKDVVDEFVLANPQYVKFVRQVPRDPRIGTDTESFYFYSVVGGGSDCALYANLENENEKVTLLGLSDPTAGGGSGVLQASSDGPNGTDKYFQVSN